MKKIFALIFLLMTTITLAGCNSIESPPTPGNDVPDNVNENDDLKTKSRISNIDVLGLASYKSFETETTQKSSKQASRKNTTLSELSNNEDEIKQYLYVSYPYDYIKIDSAQKYHFTINENDACEALDPIITNCGLGDLEVIYATFTTYNKEDYTIEASVTDTLISIKGKKGFYTILANSGSFNNQESQEIFSSHKKLTSSDINKDFEPPIYSIMFSKKQEGNYSLQFLKSDNLATYSDFSESEKYLFDGNDVEILTREVVYEVLNLVKLPEVTLEVVVTDIDLDKKIITIESHDSLKWLIIDDYTEVSDDFFSILKIYDTIEITYDDLFSDYKPDYVYANTIRIANEETLNLIKEGY